jgi:glycosyltransferase involved in cell wall biosynthesis
MEGVVSIIIPVHNEEDYLADTLESALAQTWPDKEIVVVDDGSTDDSVRVARQFEGPSVTIISQENQGGCAARNRGLREAQGDFIQYLDADDLMEPDKIEVQMNRLAGEPSGTVAQGKWERFSEDSGKANLEDVHFRDKPYYGDCDGGLEWAVDAVRNKAMMAPHAWLVPRDIVREVGSWNESLLINQDGEYFNRVVLAAERIAFCPEAKVYYRSGNWDSVSNQHTPKALASKYHSLECIAEQILVEEESSRTRRACAHAFQNLAHSAHPMAPEVVEQAIQRAKQLGGAPKYEPRGSTLYQFFCSTLGWRRAKRLQHWYYRLRYDIRI